MQISKILIPCPCCECPVEQELIKSRYISDMWLDQKPVGEHNMPRFFECPNCHYCAIDPDIPVDPITIAYIHSERYQKMMAGKPEHLEERRVKAIMELTADKLVLADLWLVYCWLLENRKADDEAMAARVKSVELRAEALGDLDDDEEKRDTLIQQADCLRQLGRFDEALDLIMEAKDFVDRYEEADIWNILKAEKRYITAQDDKPHLMSESGEVY